MEKSIDSQKVAILIAFLVSFFVYTKAAAHDKVVVIPLLSPAVERSLNLPSIDCADPSGTNINWGSERLRNIFEDRVHYAFKKEGSDIVFELWPLDRPRTSSITVFPDEVGYRLTMACGIPGILDYYVGNSFMVTDKSGLRWKIESNLSSFTGLLDFEDFGISGNTVTATLQN